MPQCRGHFWGGFSPLSFLRQQGLTLWCSIYRLLGVLLTATHLAMEITEVCYHVHLCQWIPGLQLKHKCF